MLNAQYSTAHLMDRNSRLEFRKVILYSQIENMYSAMLQRYVEKSLAGRGSHSKEYGIHATNSAFGLADDGVVTYLGLPVCASSIAVTRLDTICRCMGYAGVARVEIAPAQAGTCLRSVDHSPDPCEFVGEFEQYCPHVYKVSCTDYNFWSGLRLHGSGIVRLANVTLRNVGLPCHAGTFSTFTVTMRIFCEIDRLAAGKNSKPAISQIESMLAFSWDKSV